MDHGHNKSITQHNHGEIMVVMRKACKGAVGVNNHNHGAIIQQCQSKTTGKIILKGHGGKVPTMVTIKETTIILKVTGADQTKNGTQITPMKGILQEGPTIYQTATCLNSKELRDSHKMKLLVTLSGQQER